MKAAFLTSLLVMELEIWGRLKASQLLLKSADVLSIQYHHDKGDQGSCVLDEYSEGGEYCDECQDDGGAVGLSPS